MFLGKKRDSTEEWARSTGVESRAFPRMGLRTIVTVRAFGRESNCRLVDLSLSGLSFVAPWEMMTADPVTIEIPAPEGPFSRKRDPAFVEARVCRCVRSKKNDGWQAGVRYTRLSADADALIRRWFETFGEHPDRPARAARR